MKRHYSTYLGGTGDDVARGIALSPLPETPCCSVFVTGATTSTNFPNTTTDLPNPQSWQQNNSGFTDAFVTVLNPAGMAGDDLIYSTYLGGNGRDIGHGIAVDVVGTIHVTGETTSTDFPHPSGFGFGSGGTDAFVTVLSPSDNTLVFSWPILAWLSDNGFSDLEVVGTGIATDMHGNSYVTGWTTFTPWEGNGYFGAFPVGFGSVDALVLKLNPYFSEISYARTFGGGGDDRGFDIAVDPFCDLSCEAHVTGVTDGSFPIVDGFDDAGQSQGQGLPDVFVTKVNDPGDALIYSTYLNAGGYQPFGGDGLELWGPAIALDPVTDPNEPSPSPIAPNAYVSSSADGAVVAKLDPMPPPPLVADAGPDQTVELTTPDFAEVTIDGTGSWHPEGGELHFEWRLCAVVPCEENPQSAVVNTAIATVPLPLGVNELQLTVHSPSDGESATDTVVVIVTERENNAPPEADAGPDETFECIVQQGGAEGCLVQLNGSRSFDPDGDELTYEWMSEVGSSNVDQPKLFLPDGVHNFSLTVNDGWPDTTPVTDYVEITVSVAVNRPPAMADALFVLSFLCTDPDGRNVTLDALEVSSDPDGDPLTFTWALVQLDGEASVVYGTTDVVLDVFLPPGTYQVTLTADDGREGVRSGGGVVTIVADTTAPTLGLSLSPAMINENNHKLVAITAMIEVADACDTGPSVALTSIVSNEPDNGTGDGDTANDIQGAVVGTDDRSFFVRAERAGSNGGRVYTVTYEVTDALNNTSEAVASVTVPK